MQVTKVTEMSTGRAVSKREPLSREALQREFDYSRSVKMLQKMVEKGLISEDEFHKIDILNRQSFSPLYARIMP